MTDVHARFRPSDAELDDWTELVTARSKDPASTASFWLREGLGAALAFAAAFACTSFELVAQNGGLVVVLLVFGAYTAGQVAMQRAVNRRRRRLNLLQRRVTPLIYAERHCYLDEDGVHVRSEDFATDAGWRTFTDASEGRGLVVMWRGPMQGIYIPTRAFADADNARAALAFARDRIAAAQG